jgi:hypothetical protein
MAFHRQGPAPRTDISNSAANLEKENAAPFPQTPAPTPRKRGITEVEHDGEPGESALGLGPRKRPYVLGYHEFLPTPHPNTY